MADPAARQCADVLGLGHVDHASSHDREQYLGLAFAKHFDDGRSLSPDELCTPLSYLLALYQGQGIGQQLARTLVSRLQQEGMTALLRWVLAENPSRRFYERLGGRPVDEQTVSIGGVPLIEVAYGWLESHAIIEQPKPP